MKRLNKVSSWNGDNAHRDEDLTMVINLYNCSRGISDLVYARSCNAASSHDATRGVRDNMRSNTPQMAEVDVRDIA